MTTLLPYSPRFWLTHLGLLLLRLGARLPLVWLRRIGSILGRLIYFLSAERRRITHINLRLCFPKSSEAERIKIARQCFSEGGQAITELSAIWFGDKASIYRIAQIEGLDNLLAAKTHNRGVLLIGFHTNDLELGATVIAEKIPNFAGMYRPHSNVVFNHAMYRGRTRHFPLIDRSDSRAAVRWLKSGNVLWYAPDQDYGIAQSVFAPFFDHPAATITATSRLAKLTNAVVIPMTHFRTPAGIFIQLHPPLSIPSDDDVRDAATVNAFLENFLRQHPENYMWMHRRFKTQPEGTAAVYPERAANHKRLSVKRLNHYEKNGVLVSGTFPQWRYYQIAPTELALLSERPWWRPLPNSIRKIKQNISDCRQQSLPCATFLRQTRCSARGVDGLHLEFPPGKPLLLCEPQQVDEQMQSWRMHFPGHPVSEKQLWQCDDGRLFLIP